ncbi:MAG: hypothetical protein DRO36_01710 [Candidatus Hecatellales archaeon]|nr:MAG: hypothetical protein DRO36_01710 [Candidatus Hecatellales archaeon]
MWFDQLTFYLFLFLVVWLIAYMLGEKFGLKRYGVEIFPLVFILRTKKVNKVLEFTAKKMGRVIPTIANIFIVLSVGLMVFGAYTLTKNLFHLFYRVEKAIPIFPAVPMVTVRASLPYFLVSVAIIILVHEFAHGIVASYEKIKVKSAGFMFLAIIPGGFVEPDEESFKKAELTKKLRVLAAGSSANLVFGLIVIILLATLFPPSGVLIQGVVKDSPADRVGLQPGDVIKAVYGKPTPNLQVFREIMGSVRVGETVDLKVEFRNGTIATLNVKTVSAPENRSRAIIGIYPTDYIKITPLYLTFFWVQLWSISIAIVNMLPIYPLDGGSFVYYLLEKYLKKRYAKILGAVISAIFISLLGLNIALTFLRFGFISI